MARFRRLIEHRWVFEVAYVVLLLTAVGLILSIVGRRSGWPISQAYYNELILVQLYAAHFRHLDFFPIWSSSDGLGLGTPVLLFYQKAFFYVSGMLFILFGGALKTVLVVSIGLFLVVGAYGMRLFGFPGGGEGALTFSGSAVGKTWRVHGTRPGQDARACRGDARRAHPRC